MKITIGNETFSQEELDTWKQKRIGKAAKALKARGNLTSGQLTDRKMTLSYEEILRILKWKLAVSGWMMKMVCFLSGRKRRCSITTIEADGITAEIFIRELDKLMLVNCGEYKKVNLSVCPDHYVLDPKDGILEVIETTGNNPLPTQFFITFQDESGLKEPRDSTYTEQSVGVARLKDGTVIGGVRHQFKNTDTGMKARLLVEFPALCPPFIIKEHRKHLACEWSGWIEWIVSHSMQ